MPSGIDEIIFPTVDTLRKEWVLFVKKYGIENPKDFLNAVHMPYESLVSIQIGICTACNFNCPMCFNHFDSEYLYYKNKTLSLKEFETIIKNNAPINDLTFAVSGEPFLHPEIFTMMDMARAHVKSFTFSTNGGLLNDEKISKLKNYPIKDIYLSADGSDRKTYETYRKNGNFDHFVNMCKRLSETFGDKVKIAGTVFKENCDSLIGMPRLLAELGVNEMVIFRLFEHPGAHEKGVHKLTRTEMAEFMAELIKQGEWFNIRLRWDTRAVDPVVARRMEKITGKKSPGGDSVYRSHCAIPFQNLLIDGEGNYNFCCSMEPIPANALNTPARKLFDTEEIKMMRVMNMLHRFPLMCKKYCGKRDDPKINVSLENLKRQIKIEQFNSMDWENVDAMAVRSRVLLAPFGSMTRNILENGLCKDIRIVGIADRNWKEITDASQSIKVVDYSDIQSREYDAVLITSGAFWREILFWFYEHDPQWATKDFYRLDMNDTSLRKLKKGRMIQGF